LYDVYKHDEKLIDQLEDIKILGAKNLSDVDHACYMGANLTPRMMNVTYDNKSEVLTIKPDES
jgi:hypothetical protein